MPDEEVDDPNVVFHIRLIIKHPSLDPTLITETLKLTPHLAGMVGAPRYTPRGRPVGFFRESAWSYWEEIRGDRHFGADLERVLGLIEPHAVFLSTIVSSGGRISLLLDLSGKENI